MANGAGNGHCNEHQSNRNALLNLAQVNALQTLQHDNAHVNQSRRRCRSRNNSRDRRDKHAQQEHDAAGQSGKTRTAARLNARCGFHERRNGRRTRARTHAGTNGVGKQRFLHLWHLAFFVHHARARRGAHQRTDGVEHVNHAERDDQSNYGEPADLQEAGKVEFEERQVKHAVERRNPGSGFQRCERILTQNRGLANPVNHGCHQHANDNGRLHAAMVQQHDNEQTNEHRDNGKNHGGVCVAHGLRGKRCRQRAEEVLHYKELLALGIGDVHVGAQTDVQQHQANCGGNAHAHAQRNGINDFLADVKQRQNQEHNAFGQNDNQRRLERSDVRCAGDNGNVSNNNSEEAVQAHARRQAERFVGNERHADHCNAGCQTRGQEHGVPQVLAAVGEAVARQNVRVQGDDVSHRHERRETGDDLSANGCAVLLQLENFVHSLIFLLVFPYEVAFQALGRS